MILHKQKYGCDCGSLKVGNNVCQVLIENGVGDGRFNAYVVNSNEDIPNGAKFVMCLYMRKLHLFDYDCGDKMSENHWSGSFFFYSLNGDVYAKIYTAGNHWGEDA